MYLKNDGYEVLKFYNATDALHCVMEEQEPDLALLDVMLPDMSGFTLCQKIREKYLFPIIMLTAKVEDMDKITGLTLGADDYMTKPFAIEELLARIRLALKKRKNTGVIQKGSQLTCKGLNMDVQRYEVTYGEDRIELTHREFELLRVLLENKNIVISRETLLEKICGYDYLGETNIIDVYVRYLRSKLDDVYQVKWIQTVRGVGYVIRDDE